MESKETDILHFNLRIYGRPTDCNIKKVLKGELACYNIYMLMDGEMLEFPMHYDTEKNSYFLDEDVPTELKAVESNLSRIVKWVAEEND